MGITFQAGEFTVQAEGQTEKVQLMMDSCIGLQKQQDGTFSLVGDPYYSKQQKVCNYYKKDNVFSQDVTTNYSIEQSKGELETQGFSCTESSETEEEVVMVYQKY